MSGNTTRLRVPLVTSPDEAHSPSRGRPSGRDEREHATKKDDDHQRGDEPGVLYSGRPASDGTLSASSFGPPGGATTLQQTQQLQPQPQQHLAVKVVRKGQTAAAKVMWEIHVLRILTGHPHIVRLLDVIDVVDVRLPRTRDLSPRITRVILKHEAAVACPCDWPIRPLASTAHALRMRVRAGVLHDHGTSQRLVAGQVDSAAARRCLVQCRCLTDLRAASLRPSACPSSWLRPLRSEGISGRGVAGRTSRRSLHLQSRASLLSVHSFVCAAPIVPVAQPENVRLHEANADGSDISNEHAVLLDWGFSRRLGPQSEPISQGTPAYAAPEQLTGYSADGVSARATLAATVDVWSLGATLCEMLCGSPPFGGVDFHQLVSNVLSLNFVAAVRPCHSRPTDRSPPCRSPVAACIFLWPRFPLPASHAYVDLRATAIASPPRVAHPLCAAGENDTTRAAHPSGGDASDTPVRSRIRRRAHAASFRTAFRLYSGRTQRRRLRAEPHLC